MKLVIGERWFKDGGSYREQLTVTGIEEIDEDFEVGTTVVPTDGESGVEVSVKNSMGAEYERTMKLCDFVANYNRGEVLL
jgi:hypothetical protein